MRTISSTTHRASLVLGCVWLALAGAADAASGTLEALTSKDARGGLRAALNQGIETAVARLGVPDGFLGNALVRIPLPPALDKVDRALRRFGMSGEADRLKAAMNHAAENAVAEAAPILKDALKRMTVADAKAILGGGDDAATRYFQHATSESLRARFRPIVAGATASLQVATLYDQYAGQAAQFGLIRSEDANLNDYVTQKALDGLFLVMAEEEKAIRKDPLGQASSLIRKVFGTLRP
ncbi:MAG: DUF4197 domain-containing protein [Gammaproteobacteria bacterium]|nr:DUF4197 domain-containing protein [Gammaproteobacteria bacterium]